MGVFVKKIWIRWIVYVLVFFIALVSFNIFLNQGTTDITVEMQEATLPIVNIIYDGRNINAMHGYVERMDNATMRDSISPISEERVLSFVVDSYTTGINKISYEIRNLDGSRLIEDTVVGNYEHKKGKTIGSINLKDLIERNQEYNLNFVIGLDDGREVYYYTRIICSDNLEVKEKLDFVFEFNSKTFAQSTVKELSSYMEPNSDEDNTTLGRVSIHSNINQLGWGNASPHVIGEIGATINDISSNMMSVKLDYLVDIRADSVTNVYKVEEDYIIRKGNERFHLIDFNRTMNDIFQAQKDALVNNKIVLGILQNAPEICESDDGNIVVFQNCNSLYSYDISANKFATLYSYYEAGDTDLRDLYNKSKIKVLSVEENGNVTFMIYGYMNRGNHEGEVGVLLEYFNSVLNTIEEQAFIKYSKSPEVLMADVDKLSHLNNNKDLYVHLDGNIIRVNLDSLKVEVVANQILEDTLFVSVSSRAAVWRESSDPSSELISLDLDDGFISNIEKDPNECVNAIGYMNEDLIYGVSYGEEIIPNELGGNTLLMDRIVIRSDYGAILKEYTFDDIYIVEGTINDNQISLKRVRKTPEGKYVEIYDDQITYNEETKSGKNTIKKVATEVFENIYQIELKKNIDTKSLKFLTPKQVLFEGGKDVYVNEKARERYFVYSKGHIESIHDDAAIAVKKAYELRGNLYDSYGNEVYKRGETVIRNQIMSIKQDSMQEDKTSMNICLDTMLKQRGISRNTEYMLAKGLTPYEILNENMPNAHILNLTGCEMDVAFYYLDKDIPVMGVLDDGSTVLLVGFNELNMVWYDPSAGEIYKKGINDSRELFEANGNRFMTYSTISTE